MYADEIDALAHRIRPHYQRFLSHRPGEVLMTAHSHQAWPDVSREAHVAAWDWAAAHADHKWGHVFDTVLKEFRERVCRRLGSVRFDRLAVAPNTHELVERLLSCFPPDARVVTTDGEFHSMRRQLSRSAEAGLRVEWVAVPHPFPPAEAPEEEHEQAWSRADRSLVQSLLDAVDRQPTQLVALSQVFFGTGRVLRALPDLLEGLAERRVPVLVDTYHSFNVLPLEVDRWPGQVFVTGGGYKYAQSGEGCCWMWLPEEADRYRPRYTGWFADFDHLESPSAQVAYGPDQQRFLGSTFDPTPFFRGRRVLRFMDDEGLGVPVLRQALLRSTQRMIQAFLEFRMASKGLQLVSPLPADWRAGFVAFRRPDAQDLCRRLQERGVRTDVRGEVIRFGPAPYLTAQDVDRSMHALAEIL